MATVNGTACIKQKRNNSSQSFLLKHYLLSYPSRMYAIAKGPIPILFQQGFYASHLKSNFLITNSYFGSCEIAKNAST